MTPNQLFSFVLVLLLLSTATAVPDDGWLSSGSLEDGEEEDRRW